MKDELPKVYTRAAEMIKNYSRASSEELKHLNEIIPCIAFYESLIEHEGSRKKALQVYREWVLEDMELMAHRIRTVMKIPGMYRQAPRIFEMLVDQMFGIKAGFVGKPVPGQSGFARDMIICPYFSVCSKYGYPELTAVFCDSDDITYGNMHPKLVWARTKTLGKGGDCCVFRLYVDKSCNEERAK
jgi:hypothetical protein